MSGFVSFIVILIPLSLLHEFFHPIVKVQRKPFPYHPSIYFPPTFSLSVLGVNEGTPLGQLTANYLDSQQYGRFKFFLHLLASESKLIMPL